MSKVVISKQADHEIQEIVRYYAGHNAKRFITELKESLRIISRFPFIGSTFVGEAVAIPQIRSVAMKCFPYMLIYNIEGKTLTLELAVHGKRDLESLLHATWPHTPSA